MPATYRLLHPRGTTIVNVAADRRDELLRRGWTPVEEPKTAAPQAGQRRRKPKE